MGHAKEMYETMLLESPPAWSKACKVGAAAAASLTEAMLLHSMTNTKASKAVVKGPLGQLLEHEAQRLLGHVWD